MNQSIREATMRGTGHLRWAFPVVGLLTAMALVFTGTQVFAQVGKPSVQAKAKAPPFDAGTC
jgi:hypothetical protein